ncbi:MAG: hypothetical protein CFE24_02305 [Flavobacterium sp. BFFFF2]|nr:MAG: hypothetical protein CFE24_02305 [Flavobacterium sp. BFFFF2]
MGFGSFGPLYNPVQIQLALFIIIVYQKTNCFLFGSCERAKLFCKLFTIFIVANIFKLGIDLFFFFLLIIC